MAIYRRIPKRGFSNFKYATRYSVINVGDLNNLFEDGAEVSVEALCEVGLVRDAGKPVKVLGDGELSKKLTVSGHKFSRSASTKIADAGGEVRQL
jgi:large subunit ribosomal protein L15